MRPNSYRFILTFHSDASTVNLYQNPLNIEIGNTQHEVQNGMSALSMFWLLVINL